MPIKSHVGQVFLPGETPTSYEALGKFVRESELRDLECKIQLITKKAFTPWQVCAWQQKTYQILKFSRHDTD